MMGQRVFVLISFKNLPYFERREEIHGVTTDESFAQKWVLEPVQKGAKLWEVKNSNGLWCKFACNENWEAGNKFYVRSYASLMLDFSLPKLSRNG